MTGRVYYDLNRNDKYDGQPTDAPIANTVIFLVLLGSRQRANPRAAPLGNATTNSRGNFVIAFPPQTPGTDMAVVKDLITRDPLLEFKASRSGGAPDAEIPIPRPTKVGRFPDNSHFLQPHFYLLLLINHSPRSPRPRLPTTSQPSEAKVSRATPPPCSAAPSSAGLS